MDLSRKKLCQTILIFFSDMAIRIVDRREVGDVIFFVVVRLFDIRHSYVQMRNWLAIKNERLSSRIRLLLFSIFSLTTGLMKCAYSTHEWHYFGSSCSYTGERIWDSKWTWKIDDIWYKKCMIFFTRGKGKVSPLRQIQVAIRNLVESSCLVNRGALLIWKLTVNQKHSDVLKQNNLI